MDTETALKERARYMQTLADINNGIKIAKFKQIFIQDPGPQFDSYNLNNLLPGNSRGCIITWYCFSYSFTDPAGNEVDLGLFETRDQLFAALWQYYGQEVAEGRLTPAEATGLYNDIAHTTRNIDEAPLMEKLLNYQTYNQVMTWLV